MSPTIPKECERCGRESKGLHYWGGFIFCDFCDTLLTGGLERWVRGEEITLGAAPVVSQDNNDPEQGSLF